MKKKTSYLIALISILTGSISVPFILSSMGPGYLTGTQGLEGQFNSIYFNGAYWNTTSYPTGATPSSLCFGYTMDFDPDGAGNYKPDLCGSQQPITVDADVAPKSYVWSVKVGSKTFANGTIADEYQQFEMYRYQCSWAIDIWLSGSEAEALGRGSVIIGDREEDPTYASSAIWIKVVPRSFVYFTQNPDHVYFAPCYIGLKQDVEWAGIDEKGQKILDDSDIKKIEDIIPKVQGETPGFYYQRGGGDVVTEDTFTYYQYQDIKLDPEIFRDEYWMRFNLVQFKPFNSWDYGIYHHWKFPSTELKFLVYLFVVGQWTVYIKTGEVPVLNPHTPIVGSTNPFGGIFDFLSNPFFWMGSFLVGSFILIVLLLLFAPTALTVITQALFGRKKGSARG